MHIVILFINLGGYHAARLRAAAHACHEHGWRFTAIQATDHVFQHAWGNLDDLITFPLMTLAAQAQHPDVIGDELLAIATQNLLGCLDTLRPDVVFVPGWGFAVAQAALNWCLRHHIPAILMSESKYDDRRRVWWKEMVKSHRYVRRFAAALVGGEQHRAYAEKLGMPYERIFLGYDAVDNAYFQQRADSARRDPSAARARQPLLPARPYFLAVTRLVARKNVPALVRAYALYRQQVGERGSWDLVVCGSGEDEGTIRALIQERDLSGRVHLPGFIPYHAVGDWYGLAQAFVHPAWTEPWGLVVNEACAAGLPILCSRTAGAAELVQHGKNGFLFDPYDMQDIYSKLVAIHALSQPAREVMAYWARKIVAAYSSEHFAEGMVQAVATAVGLQSEKLSQIESK